MTEPARTPPRKRRLFRLEFGPHRVERDVDAELAFHLDMRVRRLIERGLDPDSARTQALAQFGDWDTVRSEMLDIDHQQEKAVKRANYFTELRQDTVYAVRSLRHNLGFAIVIVLSLAIGIGANTSIFPLIDALLLRPLPVPTPTSWWPSATHVASTARPMDPSGLTCTPTGCTTLSARTPDS